MRGGIGRRTLTSGVWWGMGGVGVMRSEQMRLLPSQWRLHCGKGRGDARVRHATPLARPQRPRLQPPVRATEFTEFPFKFCLLPSRTPVEHANASGSPPTHPDALTHIRMPSDASGCQPPTAHVCHTPSLAPSGLRRCHHTARHPLRFSSFTPIRLHPAPPPPPKPQHLFAPTPSPTRHVAPPPHPQPSLRRLRRL